MALKKFKPVTPGRRGMVILQHDRVTASKPHKPLVVGKKRISGRNNQGRVTMRRRGGGHKRRYRIIDFCRDKFMVPGKVATLEYDPNRTSYIALVNYADGEKRYILASESMKVGDTVAAGTDLDVVPGNCMKLNDIPEGTVISQIELKPGRGAQLVRAAGSQARLMAKEGRHGLVRLPSGEMRLIPIECQATIGQVSNAEHSLQKSGKAGRTRWLGRRPKVRGVAQNPVDHPMGGGEGRGSGGRHPTTPWGKPTKGYKTRKRKKYSNRWIVKRRSKRKDSQ